MNDQNQPLQSHTLGPNTYNKTPNPYRRNWTRWLLVYFVIAILIYGGAYFVLSRKTSKPYSINNPLPTITIQPTVASDQTSNWKTYRDEKVGFEFKYPKYWTVELTSPVLQVGSGKLIYVRINSFDPRSRGISFCEADLISARPPGINEVPRCERFRIEGFSTNAVIDWEVTDGSANAVFDNLSVTLSDSSLKINKEKVFFRTFLSTFRFIEAQSLRTKNIWGSCVFRDRGRLPDKSKALTQTGPSGIDLGRIEVRFKEGTQVRLRNGKFVSLCGADLSEVNKIIISDLNLILKRVYSRSEEELESEFQRLVKINPQIADSNLAYYILIPGNTDFKKISTLVTQLNALDIVEIAYPGIKPPINASLK